MGINDSHHSNLYISVYGFIISINKIMLYLALYFLCVLVCIDEAGTKSMWLKVINLEKGILYVYRLNKDLKYTETVNYEKGKKKIVLDCRTSGILSCACHWINTSFLLICHFCPVFEFYLPNVFSIPASLIFSRTTRKFFFHPTCQKRALSVWN